MVLVFLLTATTGYSAEQFQIGQPISTKDMEAWQSEFQQTAADCRRVVELKKTFVCLFPTAASSDRSMERAALWVEGNFGHPAHTVPAMGSLPLQQFVAAGHNRNSKDLYEFYIAVQYACEKYKSYCLNVEEKAFYKQLFFPLQNQLQGEFYIITFAPSSNWQTVITHELWHAYFFEDSTYRMIALDFWNQLSLKQRSQIRADVIGHDGFYGQVEHVLLDEFQAYCKDGDSWQFNIYCTLFDDYLASRNFVLQMRP